LLCSTQPDITVPHSLSRNTFNSFMSTFLEQGSPLAHWVSAFLASTFNKLDSLYSKDEPLSLHDPLCVWYLLASPEMTLSSKPEDIRIETTGQWTRGMCLTDKRQRSGSTKTPISEDASNLSLDEVPGDSGNWLSNQSGNRIWRCVDSEWKQSFGTEMLRRIFA